MRCAFAVALGLVVLGCSPAARDGDPAATSKAASTSNGSSAPEVRLDGGAPACDALFTPPNDATPLCTQHVLGDDMEISWRSWTTKVSRKDVYEPYRQKLAACPQAKETRPGHVALGPARLMVYDVDDEYPTCETKPAAGEKTVVIVSYGYPR